MLLTKVNNSEAMADVPFELADEKSLAAVSPVLATPAAVTVGIAYMAGAFGAGVVFAWYIDDFNGPS